ncbi:MAG: CdaR family protein [Ruminococcus sp.]|nr:CdaR family protein [Ruminococcus sp.]
MRFFQHRSKEAKGNLPMIILSLLLAILIWLVVAMTLYPSIPKTIENIPLSVDIAGSPAADSGLSVISCDVDTVDVQLVGSRTQIGNLNAENLTAYVDYENVTSTGKKTLSIKVKSDSGINYEVKSITPSTAVVELDKYDTLPFEVKPKIPNVKYAEGKTIDPDEFTCEPDIINITGPSAQLAKISSVYAVSDRNLTLDSSYTLNSDEVQLFSEDGTRIDASSLLFDTSTFTINIPVLTQKTVKPVVQILNAPTDFDQSCLDFKMSADSLTIASNNSFSEIPDTLDIGKIPLSDLDIGYSNTFDISSVLETSGMINKSGIDSITVTLNDEGLAKKEIVLDGSSIRLSNTPNDNYDYDILTQKLTISVIGPEGVISELTASDFTADVNLLNADTSQDQFNYDVTISCLTHDNVWSVTKAKVSIKKTAKTITATSGAAVLPQASATTAN